MSLGYENAPIAQLISVLTILLGWFHGSSKILSLDLYKLGEGQLWRLLSSQIVFESTAEAIVGLMLIYTFRQFERQMGTRKFGFFVFLSLIISLFNLMTFQILLLSVDIHFVPASGPYFLIYAMLAIFYCKFIKWNLNENAPGIKLNWICSKLTAFLLIQTSHDIHLLLPYVVIDMQCK